MHNPTIFPEASKENTAIIAHLVRTAPAQPAQPLRPVRRFAGRSGGVKGAEGHVNGHKLAFPGTNDTPTPKLPQHANNSKGHKATVTR
jgi:hypothetical protein